MKVKNTKSVFLLLCLSFCIPGYADDVTHPADVLMAVQTIADDIESVRRFMGKPIITLRKFEVEAAEPRHIYSQAQTLYRKVNRLAIEIGGATRRSPSASPEHRDIDAADVLRLVKGSQRQLELVKETLGIKSSGTIPRRDDKARLKEVFEEIVQVNRQLNLIIGDPFSPSDVHDQLTLASAYLGGVLAKADQAPFDEVAFEANQQPIDVYSSLLDCLVLNQQVGEKFKIATLRINPRRLRRDESLLSDNYDMATMLVSDIAFWSERIEHSADEFPPSDPMRHIFPSHVLQRSNLVAEQLRRILAM